MQNGKPQKSCLLSSYSQLDKDVSRLAALVINDDRRCRSGRYRRWFGRTASPASKAFNKFRLRRLRRPRRLMCLVLPLSTPESWARVTDASNNYTAEMYIRGMKTNSYTENLS